jgi:predicted ArsR family transcriptional regulator
LNAARIGQALESLLKGGLATMESKPSRGRPIELWRAK